MASAAPSDRAESPVQFYGRSAFVGDPTSGFNPLQHCGSRARFRLTRLTASPYLKVLAVNQRALLWSIQDGHVHGMFLNSHKPFAIHGLPPDRMPALTQFALGVNHVYALTSTNQVWVAPLPRALRVP